MRIGDFRKKKCFDAGKSDSLLTQVRSFLGEQLSEKPREREAKRRWRRSLKMRRYMVNAVVCDLWCGFCPSCAWLN